jgi:glycosyltransferase involved in cell wall biosynthesis
MTAAGQRRVLWIDPHFQIRSPAMQSMVRALPHLLEKNWQIEVWCLEADPVDARAMVHAFPRFPAMGFLEAHWFWFAAWLRLLGGRCRGRSWDIVHTSGPTIPGVHVISVHFHSRTWLGLIQPREWKEFARWVITFFVTIQEHVVLAFTGWSVLLPVSRALAQRIEHHRKGNQRIQVLPNALDSGRFNPSVRGRYRDATREKLAAGADDFVFLFASTGHYRRKGLWTAVQALKACRSFASQECGMRLRFVVVGAGEPAQQKLAPELDAGFPDWREWVSLHPPCDDIERWYAGADAFLFPSVYETFSLVSLEASACGLPLLLTAFDGQEMYLRDGVNGVLLPWDVALMPAKIQQFLKDGRHQLTPGVVDAVDVPAYATALDQVYQQVVQTS